MTELLISLVVSFFIGLLIGSPVIKYLRKQKAGQSILEYVEMHSSKQGTPTMGGIIFLASLIFASIILLDEYSYLAIFTILITLGYGLIGFLDDYIKIRFKRNLGLKPYQKIIGQGGLSLIVALACYFNPLVTKSLVLPFGLGEIYVGAWIIPIIIFIFLAVTNAVNLTDGLDGLAGSVSAVYLCAFGVLLSAVTLDLYNNGASNELIEEYGNLMVVIGAMIGGLLAFLFYNSHPAKVFMGDVGSLALGALIASLACFTGLIFYIPFLGLMFVISTVSVIMQVLYYKKTKKRIFLMAPLHHHFEKKGVNESKIVSIYIIITIIISAITLILD